MRYESFDINKLRVNIPLFFISLILSFVFVMTTDSWFTILLGLAMFLFFGWSIVFGKYKGGANK